MVYYLQAVGWGFFHFFSWTVLVSGHETYPSHLFVIKLQEHLEAWLRIGAAGGYVLIIRTLVHKEIKKKKKKLYESILTGKTKFPKDPYKISKDSTEGQRKPAEANIHSGDVSFGKCDRKRPPSQPQLRAF